MSVKHKLLLITPYSPYPPYEGGRIAQYAVIDYMRFSFDIILVLRARTDEDLIHIAELRKIWDNVIIEVINIIPVQQKETVNDKIKNTLRNIYSGLTLKKAMPVQQITYSDFENSFFINLEVVKDRNFLLQLHAIINKYSYDLVEIDFVDFMDLVHCFPASIPKVFVEIELRFVRLQTCMEALGRKADAYEQYIVKKVKEEELGFLKLYDGVITMSSDDKVKLDRYLPADFVFSSPYSVLDNHFIKADTKNLKVEKLVLLGAEDHYPNKDGFDWYVNELQPAMKKYGHLPIHVVGKWTMETKETYKNNPNIRFAGFVEDLISYCANSIMLVPIRIGSGIRTKILYGMAQALPVISTTIGCEGLPVTHEKNIWIANNAREFESAIETILEKPAKAIEVLLAGQQLVKEKFSQGAAAELRGNYYKKLIKSYNSAPVPYSV